MLLLTTPTKMTEFLSCINLLTDFGGYIDIVAPKWYSACVSWFLAEVHV